jgi:ribosomal protein L12E/L44/L45/RPP1/RPP2
MPSTGTPNIEDLLQAGAGVPGSVTLAGTARQDHRAGAPSPAKGSASSADWKGWISE